MKNIQTLVISLVFALCSPHAFAADDAHVCNDFYARDETASVRKKMLELLREKNYPGLKDALDDRLARFAKGELSDLVLSQTLSFADRAEPDLEPLLDEFLRVGNSDFNAHMARGRYHLSVGYKMRGKEFSSKTSDEQIKRMSIAMRKAAKDFEASAKLDPGSILPLVSRIDIAANMESIDQVLVTVARADKLSPNNLAVRINAAQFLDGRYGGDFANLDKLINGAKSAGISVKNLRVLQYVVELHKGRYLHHIEKRLAEAAKYYDVAARTCSGAAVWNELMVLHQDREDWPALEKAANGLLKLRPTDAWGMSRRGWALEKQGRLSEALLDYEAAANGGQSWAQNKLGWLYLRGEGVSMDKARARKLFGLASAQGNQTAIANLQNMGHEK